MLSMPNEFPAHFALAGADWTLSFSRASIAFLEEHKQRRWFQRESVGQLFSRDLTAGPVCIDEATLLKPAKSSRASVTLDLDAATSQRNRMLSDGLHCVGLWHTHPEPQPSPSGMDARLAADHALAARSVLNGLCFVIVGTKPFPDGWFVAVHDGDCFHRADLLACG
jgi:proteasome lid subunit RPN8/RPN11